MDNMEEVIKEMLRDNADLNNATIETVCEKYSKSIAHIVKIQTIKDICTLVAISIMFCSFVISYFKCDYTYVGETSIENTNNNTNENK